MYLQNAAEIDAWLRIYAASVTRPGAGDGQAGAEADEVVRMLRARRTESARLDEDVKQNSVG